MVDAHSLAALPDWRLEYEIDLEIVAERDIMGENKKEWEIERE